MKELSLEEAALAWAQGKRVEARPVFPGGAPWSQIAPLGTVQNKMWPASIFNDTANSRSFRLTPEPPAKKWRPYTQLDGVPLLGERVIRKGGTRTYLIIGVLEEVVHIGNSHYTFQNLMDEFTWSDGSPCGVEVDA